VNTIAFIGHAVWDHCFMVPRLLAEPGKFVASAYFSRPGGMSANAALAAQRLRDAHSPRVVLAAPMGTDDAGLALHTALSAAGVEVLPSCVVSGARTSVSAVLVDADGERQGHNVRGNAQASCALPDASWLDGVVALQVDPRWPEAAATALQLARQRGIVSMLDGDVAPPAVLRQLAPLADWAVFSSAGLCAWGQPEGMADAPVEPVDALFQRLCAALPHTQLVVTLGAAGLLWRAPGQPVVHRPAHAVEVVNTNGAGDTLHGALLLALAEGLPPSEALHFGAAAAACSVTGRPYTRAQAMSLLA